MSLIGALNIGSSALAVQQAALQVTGNNISNAGNADYTRQVANTTANPDQQIGGGLLIGTGADITSIQRQIDDALEARLRGSTSDSSAADTSQQYLTQIETTFNALGDTNLSSQMSQFFNDWSSLANKPQDMGQRQIVLQDGQSLADQFTARRGQLTTIEDTIDQRVTDQAKTANDLAQQVANLNGRIAVTEGGGNGQANDLRDQRDSVLKQLSGLMDIKTVPQDNGTVNVYVGSEPLVIGTTNQGIGVQTQVVNGQATQSLVFKANNGAVPATSGSLGALISVRGQTGTIVSQLDGLANNLIFELNKLHASGQGLDGISTAMSSNAVKDPAAVLNTPAAGLPFTPTNGSFVVHVRDKASGQESSTLVQVDLDGLNNNDTSLNSLAASLSAITGVTASITGGKLTVATSSASQELTFSQDSSGVLAALGINNFYTGHDASDIAVNTALVNQPTLLAAAKNGDSADNQTALAIAALGAQPLASLNGASLDQNYQSIVNGISAEVSAAKNNSDAAQAITATLTAQHDSISGVSLDEEAVNLMQQQRAFQGAARLITTVDQMLQAMLNM